MDINILRALIASQSDNDELAIAGLSEIVLSTVLAELESRFPGNNFTAALVVIDPDNYATLSLEDIIFVVRSNVEKTTERSYRLASALQDASDFVADDASGDKSFDFDSSEVDDES